MKALSAIGALLVGTLVLACGSLRSIAQAGAVPTGGASGNGGQSTSEVQHRAGLAPGDSRVRIVRLSEIRGSVQMDRGNGHGLEATIVNMPIVEGSKLQTEIGLAEVEFEDGSALRITPYSLVEFPQLILRGSGGMASTVKLVQGLIYVSRANTKGDAFIVEAGADGKTSMTVSPSTHLRIEVNDPQNAQVASKDSQTPRSMKTMTLAVFTGSVDVQGPSGQSVVGKRETLTIGGPAETQPDQMAVAKNVSKNAFDDWDKDEQNYQERYTKGNTFAGSPYAYGISDLNYYGSFTDIGGCGTKWQPYFVSAGWDPYANGVWAQYAGAGYSWVSPYPWGWMPYHFGSWSYCPTGGWGWLPGGSWLGLNNVAATGASGKNPVRPHPILPPATGGASLVLANRIPLVMSKLNAQGSFEFRKNSAGLGIPHGELGSLKSISQGVAQHGFVSMRVDVVPSAAGAGPGGQMARGPAALRPASSGGNGGSGAVFSAPQAGGGGASASHAITPMSGPPASARASSSAAAHK